MIKPIKITPLNTTNTLSYKCDKCGYCGTIALTNGVVHTDNDGNPNEPLDYSCPNPKCGAKL